jgi:hypothetical protein
MIVVKNNKLEWILYLIKKIILHFAIMKRERCETWGEIGDRKGDFYTPLYTITRDFYI